MKQILLVLFSLLCIPLYSQQWDFNPYETKQPTEWSGTGWMLNGGYVVTNHHVADNARTIKLKFPKENGWNELSAETVLLDEENDLAILTDIPVRTIQQYEQRRKDINKVSLEYAYRLSKALMCDITQLME